MAMMQQGFGPLLRATGAVSGSPKYLKQWLYMPLIFWIPAKNYGHFGSSKLWALWRFKIMGTLEVQVHGIHST